MKMKMERIEGLQPLFLYKMNNLKQINEKKN